jgi:hypothetical protein
LELFHLLRRAVSRVCHRGVSFLGFSVKAEMERRFSTEAKAFYFSMKADVSEIRLEERRKGFSGVIFLGLQCSAWLLATVEEALKKPVKKDFVKSYREDVKALMVHGGGNKADRYLEVAAFAEGGRKKVIWLPKGREGWGWYRVVGELRKMLTFLASKTCSLVFEASTTEGIHKGGVSSSRLGGVSPSLAEVARGKLFFMSSILGCGFQS